VVLPHEAKIPIRDPTDPPTHGTVRPWPDPAGRGAECMVVRLTMLYERFWISRREVHSVSQPSSILGVIGGRLYSANAEH
jgi:hypothetical protein